MENEYEVITIPEDEEMPNDVRMQTPDSLPPLEDIASQTKVIPADNSPEQHKLEDGMQAIYDNINKLLAEYGDQYECLLEDEQDEESGSCLEPIDYVLDNIRTDMKSADVDPKTREITRAYLDKVCCDLSLHYDLYYGKYKSLKMPSPDGLVYWLDSIIESIKSPAPKLTYAATQQLCRDILKRIHTKGAELTFVEYRAEDGKRFGYEPVAGCTIDEQTRGIMEICAYTSAWLDTNPDYLIWL